MRRGGRGFSGVSSRLQMNIPRQLQPPPQPQFGGSSNGAPLMTNHYQGLKDIDMELELLKRKREIIEQQQQMLSNSYRQRNEFQQSYSEPRESRYDNDYTALYDEPREDSYGRAESRKRVHSVPVWESETTEPPKRFSGPGRGGKSFGSRYVAPASSRPPPARFESRLEPRFPVPKPYRKAAPPPKKPYKDFNPSKVSKPSAAPAPAPLARYEPAERKRLVAEAGATTTPADFWLLRADRTPHAKLLGRLELALGAIMKDIKAANPQHDEIFKSTVAMRTMKTAVRDRIRNVMIGKHVPSIDLIKAAYYQTYPCTKHEYIVMQGLDIMHSRERDGKPFIVDADDPQTFFKTNMQYLMNKKMDEMIQQLQLIYGSGAYMPPQRPTRYRNRARNNAKNTQTGQEKPKLEQNEDQDEKTETMDVTETPKQETMETGGDANAANTTTENTEVEEVPYKQEEEEAKKLILKYIDNEQYMALDKLMAFKMLHILKSHTLEMLKIMESSNSYRQAKLEIVNMAKAKVAKTKETGGEETQKAAVKKTHEKRGPPKYFVRILGVPSLPKRKVMEAFFEDFNPRLIKKHRTVHNLLFVGFTDKEPYDKILASDGIAMGRFTLDIKVSERNPQPKANTSDASVVTIDDEEKHNESTEIGSDLETKITDLLQSIRNSEENVENTDDKPQTDDANNENESTENKPTEETKNICAENVEVVQKSEDDDVIHFDDVPKENGDTVVDQNQVGANETKDVAITLKKEKETNETVEIKDNVPTTENREDDRKPVEVNEEAEEQDEVAELKSAAKEVPKTPTRASARLATPGGIKTRRMSKLAE